MRRVAVTGIGILSPIGNNRESITSALRTGASGIGPIPDWDGIAGMRSLVCGQVDGVNPKAIPRTYRRTMGRIAVLGTLAARDAVADAGIDAEELASVRTGVIMGSTTGSAPYRS